MPTHGKHVLTVNTKEKDAAVFRNTCNYLLVSDEACVEPPFTLDPNLNGRIGQLGKERLLEPISHPDALVSLEDATETLNIEMNKKQPDVPLKLKFELEGQDGSKRAINHFAFLYDSNGDVGIDLRFPESGTYHLSIGAKTSGHQDFHYLIEVGQPTPKCLPFPTALPAWARSDIIHSPFYGILKKHTDVKFDVEIAG